MQFATTMHRACVIIATLSVSVAGLGQTSATHPLRTVTVHLPPGIHSRSAQVVYFLYGLFGASGRVVGQTSDEIDTYVDGVAASEIKIVAYLPGCDFVLLDIPLHGESESRQFVCTPLPSLPFRGEVFPISTTTEQPRVIEVRYLAGWASRFFGISDGAVPNFRIATIQPDENGQFQLEVPDVLQRQMPGDGFQFILRDPNTWNIIAFLKPAEHQEDPLVLAPRPSYHLVRFVAEMR